MKHRSATPLDWLLHAILLIAIVVYFWVLLAPLAEGQCYQNAAGRWVCAQPSGGAAQVELQRSTVHVVQSRGPLSSHVTGSLVAVKVIYCKRPVN